MRKRTLAMVMALMLLVCIIPVAAMAAETCEHGCASGTATSNGDGYHNIVCSHGVTIWTLPCDTDRPNGACSCCGYKAPAQTPAEPEQPQQPEDPVVCNCFYGYYYSNDDGTHSVICEHGNVVGGPWACTPDEDGVCTDCGYVMPVEETPDSKPTTGLDKVPKTGDNGSAIVVPSLIVLALFATVALVRNKKFVF